MKLTEYNQMLLNRYKEELLERQDPRTKEEKLSSLMTSRQCENWPNGWTCDDELRRLGFYVENDCGVL